MFSLQRILGRPAEFFGLLEQSAAGETRANLHVGRVELTTTWL